MNTLEKPLVSIIVITYNSAKYVLETLESAKNQTYNNTELIVSDDGSDDQTIEICKNWIEENKDRFVRAELITVEENTGIPANLNRGVRLAKGFWIKPIAGDDVLLPRYLEKMLEFACDNLEAQVLFSRIFYLKGSLISKDSVIKISNENTLEGQRRYLLSGSGLKAPSVLIRRAALINCGLYFEKYKLFEDAPMWLSLNKSGYLFAFNQEFLVKYRIHENNVFSGKKMFYSVNARFHESFCQYCNDILYDELHKDKYFISLLKLKMKNWIDSQIGRTQEKHKFIAMFFWLFKFELLTRTWHKIKLLVFFKNKKPKNYY